MSYKLTKADIAAAEEYWAGTWGGWKKMRSDWDADMLDKDWFTVGFEVGVHHSAESNDKQVTDLTRQAALLSEKNFTLGQDLLKERAEKDKKILDLTNYIKDLETDAQDWEAKADHLQGRLDRAKEHGDLLMKILLLQAEKAND